MSTCCPYRLSKVMEVKNISPTDLALATGINVSTIYRYMGRQITPARENLEKIATVLKVEPDWLIGDSDNRPLSTSEDKKISNKEKETVEKILPLLSGLNVAEVNGVLGIIRKTIDRCTFSFNKEDI